MKSLLRNFSGFSLKTFSLAVGMLGSLLLTSPSFANKLGIWPIDPIITQGETATKIQVKNIDPLRPIRLQARLLLWQQENGEDTLTPQSDIVISPPQVEVAPGVEQLFRIIVRNPIVPQGTESSYRIIFEEVPGAEKVGNDTSQLKFTMRYSIPLFVNVNKGNADKKLKKSQVEQLVHYSLTDNPQPLIIIHNQSPWAQRMSKVKIHNAQGEIVTEIAQGLWGYALPNSYRQFQLTQEQFSLLRKPAHQIVFSNGEQEYRIESRP